MSHFIIDYSANLESQLDIAALVELVRQAAIDTGYFPLGDIRVRAIRCEHYAIADGRDGFAYLAMLLRLGATRDHATRKRAGEQIFHTLSQHLDPLFADDSFALSFEIQVSESSLSWSRNGIHDLLVNEARHG